MGINSEIYERKKIISVLIDGKMFEIFYEHKKLHKIRLFSRICGLKPLVHSKKHCVKSCADTQILRMFSVNRNRIWLSVHRMECVCADSLCAYAIEQKQNSAQTGELRHLRVCAFAQNEQKQNSARLCADSARTEIGPREPDIFTDEIKSKNFLRIF